MPRLATLLCQSCLISVLMGVFFATASLAQDLGGFVKFQNPVPLPSILLNSLEGQETNLSELLDRRESKGYVLLHLWSPSCPRCIAELKQLEKARDSLLKQNMIVYSVAEDPNGLTTVPAFLRRHDLQAVGIYVDTGLTGMRTLRPAGVPVTYIISPSKQIEAYHQGPFKWVNSN